ncbi:MAG: NACHT domain-containing protein [Ilumatobacteraceae bacterium]|nr:NACHT domain-containing protein [Ilumatobacteraceae bacterium]
MTDGAMQLSAAIVQFLGTVLPAWQDRKGRDRRRERGRFIDAVGGRLAMHHVEVVRWCEESHLPSSLVHLPTDAPTIGLHLRSIPRRLGGAGSPALEELELLFDEGDFAVLGDPGAGKTTTLRRLAREVALEAPSGDPDWFQFVILIVCRERDWRGGLYPVLADITGVKERVAALVDDPEIEIRHLLAQGALILVDGLDEVKSNHRSRLEMQLVQLTRGLTNSKMIVSCRSAAYAESLGAHFKPVEILPLTGTQIRAAVAGWLSAEEAERFHEAVAAQGGAAAELADRPLFLAHMVTAFKRQGAVPDRRVDLCRTIVRLVLQDWDETRSVQRSSAYAGFGPDEKMEMLSEVAYQLYQDDLIRFGDENLTAVMRDIAPTYGLPKQQTRQIVREIESHTGLVVKVGLEYEFSHLSIQEFLAGDYLARGRTRDLIAELPTHPELVAVATALSSDASGTLGSIADMFERSPDDLAPLHQYLRRLVQERPRFKATPELGHAVLRLTTISGTHDVIVYDGLVAMKAVRAAIKLVIKDTPEAARGDRVYFTCTDLWGEPITYTAPWDFTVRVLGRPPRPPSA